MSEFATKKEVFTYLDDNGWKVSQSGLYKHCSEGKLTPNKSGEYEMSAVDKYAKTHLRRKETGKKVDEEQQTLQRTKLEMEIKKLAIQTAKEEHNLSVAQGKFIPREDLELELASRAVALENAIKHLIQTRSQEWIGLVTGEIEKTADLIEMMSNDIDRVLTEFADTETFQVILEADVQG